MATSGHEVTEVEPRLATPQELARVHSPEYINEVLNNNRTSQWAGHALI
jgi:acetoin utilization deacetylase AcuC-like enzyme